MARGNSGRGRGGSGGGGGGWGGGRVTSGGGEYLGAATGPTRTPASAGGFASSAIEAVAPSSRMPPRCPATTSENSGGKYAATNQKSGRASGCRVATSR